MAVDVPGTVEVVLRGECRNQLTVNRFHYKLTDGAGEDWQEIATAFQASVLASLIALQGSSQRWDTLEVRPLYGTELGYLAPLGLTGDVETANTLPPFFSFKFRLLHNDRRVRGGHKRFAGVLEEHVNQEGINSVYATSVNTLEVALAAPLVYDSVTYSPVVVHYPTNRYPVVITPLVSQALFDGWTTQNSRKTGRGA